jgi:hypothetical protein
MRSFLGCLCAGFLFVVLGLVACTTEETSPVPGDDGVSDACERAFAAAAAVSDLEDTVEDLYPAVRACNTVEEWTAASEAYPAALDGADPVLYLTNTCLYGPPDLADTDLCRDATD